LAEIPVGIQNYKSTEVVVYWNFSVPEFNLMKFQSIWN